MSKSLPPPPRPSSYHPRATTHYPSGPSGSSGRGSRTPPPPLPHQLSPLSTLSEGPMTLAPGPPSAAGSSVSAASVNPDAALSSADMDPHLAQFGGESLGPPGATRRPTRRVRSIERTWAWVKSRSSVYEPGFVLEVDEDAILDPGPSRASRAARPMTIHAAATNLIPEGDGGAAQRRQSDVDPDERRRRRQGLTPESGLRPPPRPRPASRVFASPSSPASSSPTTPTSSIAGGISGGSLNTLLEHGGGGRASSVTPTNTASSGRHLARPVMPMSASTSTVPTVSKPFPTTGGAPPGRPPGPKRVQSISDIVRRHSSAVALAEESAKDRARAELATRPDLVERARAAKAAAAATAAAAAAAAPSKSASAPTTSAPTPTSPPSAPPAPPPVNPPAPGHRREASLASFHSAQSTGTSDTDSVVRDFRLAQAAYDHLNKPSASAPASPQTNTQAQFQKSPPLPRPPSALAAQPVHSAPRRAPSLEQSNRYYTASTRERSQAHSPVPGTDPLVRSPSLLSPKSASPLPPDDDAHAMALYLRQPQLNRMMHVPRPYPDRPLQVSFADLGKADGRPVLVFLGLGCVRYMCALYDDLARALGLRLICIDRWGLGKTDQVAQENRGPLDWANVVRRVVDDLGIERFQVVAHSAGAPYALATVLKMERRVHGKIHLLAPWVGGDVEGYKWLKWVPNGVIKSALAAEWRLESYFMGKAPTVKANNGRKEGLNGRSNKDAMMSTTSLDSDASRSRSSFAHDMRPQSSADSRLEHEGFDSFSSDLYSSLGWNAVAPSPFANVTSSPNFLHALNQASHAESLSGTTADLLSVILGRDTKPWGFAYTDIRNPCKIWYGADDDRVSEKSMRWMERAMDAELTVVPDEGHNLMSSRTVMYDVLDSLAEEYRSL